MFVTSSSEQPHFRVLGVPVRVEPSFFFLTVVLSMSRDLLHIVEWVAVAFVCILVHELGHALTARRFGQSVRISLHAMGGTAWHWSEWGAQGLSTTRRVLVALAGPFAGFALGAVAFALPPFHNFADEIVSDVLWICWGYGVLNLLPILPLDGGNALAAVLRNRLGKERGDKAADVVSVVAGVLLIGVAIWLRSFPLGFLVGWLALARLLPLLKR